MAKKYILKFDRHHASHTTIYKNLEEAINMACCQLEFNDGSPKEIVQGGKTVLTIKQIFDEWEERYYGEVI
jgi:hypothetical protein